MEWFVLSALVPGSVELGALGLAGVVVGVGVALVPAVLAARHALARGTRVGVTPELRVIEGGRELSRHAA